jgi:hypothetical protein
MLSLATERESLAKADQDITEGEERITRQIDLIQRLRRGGYGVAAAETLLEALRQTLQTWREHRDEILRTIARLESLEIERAAKPSLGRLD